MRKTSILMISMACILMISCEKEAVKENRETGQLNIRIGIQVNEYEARPVYKATPDLADFRVIIYRADGTEAMSFERAADMPEAIELVTGDYFVEAYSDNLLPAAFENPYYYGTSELFSVESNLETSIQLTCTIGNTLVSVVYSDNVIANFLDYETSVSSEFGSLLFTADETRVGYFQTAALEILVSLSYQKPDGSAAGKTLSGSIPDPQPARHYQLVADASIDEGMAGFQILLDSLVSIELVEISEGPGLPQEGLIAYGDLLITEVMMNPTALSDTDGEWFEVYNNSSSSINLQNLVIRRDDLNTHTIAENIELPAGAFAVLQRTEGASSAGIHYVFGSGILLPNTGAVLGIYNEDLQDGPGALIFSLDYGVSGFPEASGASIALNPASMNSSDAVLPSSWCISSSVFETGDLGTPGLDNDICQ